MNDHTGRAKTFDRDAWLERLLELNPWAHGLSPGTPEFKNARKKASLERMTPRWTEDQKTEEQTRLRRALTEDEERQWQQKRKAEWEGRRREQRDSWNIWVKEMLGLKAELKHGDRWRDRAFQKQWTELEKDESEKMTMPEQWELLRGPELEMAAWFAISTSDFSETERVAFTSFQGVTFPGAALFIGSSIGPYCIFAGTRFTGDAMFNGAIFMDHANFGKAVFSERASFKNATFTEDAGFDDATFTGAAEFGLIFSGHDACGTAFLKKATFWGATFSSYAGFGGAKFGSEADFRRATFSDDARFFDATFSGSANFSGITFAKAALFGHTAFAKEAMFDDTTFCSDAWFEGASFGEKANFKDSTFSGNANFEKASFSQEASFVRVKVSGYAGFEFVTFSGPVTFQDALFQEQAFFTSSQFSAAAEFHQSTFENYTSFSSSVFRMEAGFEAIRAARAFTLGGAKFNRVPDFSQAQFSEPPRLDDVVISRPGHFRSSPKLSARYRALKRLANQGQDFESEQAFFADELKSRRWVVDRPWGWRYWFGLLYQLLSNFGQSIARPLAFWLLSVAVFSWYYLYQHAAEAKLKLGSIDLAMTAWDGGLKCLEGHGFPLTAALQYSLKKGLIVVGDASDKGRQALACLYGIDQSYPSAKSGNELIPLVRDAVAFASIAQTLISVALIFLFLLALRNFFRIK